MFEAGASYREINETVGTPISTLRVWCKRDEWKVAAKPDQLATSPATLDDDVPIDLPSQQQEYQTNMARAAVVMSRKVAAMPSEEVIQKADKLKSLDVVNRKALKIESEKPVCAIQIGVLCQPVRASKKDDGRLRFTHNPVELIEAE